LSERSAERSEPKIGWSGAVSGRCRKRWSGSRARSGRSWSGNGAESQSYRNRLERGARSEERGARSEERGARSEERGARSGFFSAHVGPFTLLQSQARKGVETRPSQLFFPVFAVGVRESYVFQGFNSHNRQFLLRFAASEIHCTSVRMSLQWL